MKVVYRNDGDKITNEIWRSFFCQCCKTENTWGNISLVNEIMDHAGGEEYICQKCVDDGSAKEFIKKNYPR